MTTTDTDSAQRRQLTLGVLGHVDHGKTALVRALTGIETDRLTEERERGLSIVAGYAWFESDDTCIDLIDAPGHQAFIRAMIAAASGIDAAMLIVAANEGVMPQTREHVAIAQLLGIRTGIVVLTKCDLVSGDELSDVRARVCEYLSDTFLGDAPILPVAAVDGTGITNLRAKLIELESNRVIDSAVPFYMPVDRSFAKSGFGRVVTGTVHAGTVAVGDELFVTPGDRRIAVRGIQVHGRSVQSAGQGDRAALNLRGPAADAVAPGMFLGHEFAALESRRLDVLIEPVPEFAGIIANGAALRVLIGTAEAQARLRLLEHDRDMVGGRVLAQLRCDRPLPARTGMRFVLRSNSPGHTVGGGTVIDAQAPRRRRFDTQNNAGLVALADSDAGRQLQLLVDNAGAAGIARRELQRRLGVGTAVLDALLDAADLHRLGTGGVCSIDAFNAVVDDIETALRSYHEQYPQHAGLKQAELAGSLSKQLHEGLVQEACELLRSQGRIAASNDCWHLSDFDPAASLSDTQQRLVEKIEAVFSGAGVASPVIAELVGGNAAARESLRYLMEKGRVVRLQTRGRATMLALHASVIDAVQQQISREFPYPAQFAVKDVRDLLGTTRKHVVPLLEHLDASGFTLRKGDLRQIRK
jgi:selenocysteine-specific elongation factor